MRTKQLFTLVTVVLMMSACTPTPRVDYTGKPKCLGNADKKIMVKAKRDELSVKPPNLCVKNGDTVIVQINGPGAGEVKVVGKDGVAWIAGNNSSNKNKIDFKVPPASKAPPDKTYLYDIYIDGYGVIDPMLTIEK